MGYETATKTDAESVVPEEIGGMWFVNCHGRGGPWLVSGLAASYPKGFGRSQVGIPDFGAG
ncbi:hypothetical protein [Natrarchaeobius chitinivorans]|uniref:hypothetical protein n=1 Tax=Natrarchaeobius chitinivorans TaxID=1679083 RepID=UPI001FB1E960|nr:hypothetical protein [Natrarchaeobius chitinivorans]